MNMTSNGEFEEFDEANEHKIKPLIILKEVLKKYEIGDWIVRAVDNVNLSIFETEFVAIVGPSGAGKTTLLNLIAGLDSVDQGEIYNSGIKITDMSEESLATFRIINIGFIFQNYNLISTLTAEENVIFPMMLAGMTLNERREKAIKLLEEMGLNERKEHLPFQLSAGEQQRVAIARALGNDPPIIIADEPTANLDTETAIFISKLFRKLKENKKTIIVATHDERLTEQADRIILFNEAQIVKQDIIHDILKENNINL
jgi:putative ABC transport system ATP-binding protein